MKKLLTIYLFAACATFHSTIGEYRAIASELDNLDAVTITLDIWAHGSCTELYDFLRDTALDHNLNQEDFCEY